MTARPWFASNARSLLEARQNGLSPDEPVTVSIMGNVAEGTTLFVRDNMPADRMDWRMLVNLQVVVWANSKTQFDRVDAVLFGIAQARPKELQLCFVHGETCHLIDCGSGWHRPAVMDIPASHEFLWQPINLGATDLGYRIKAALHKNHKPGARL